jgi:hypothetical protein
MASALTRACPPRARHSRTASAPAPSRAAAIGQKQPRAVGGDVRATANAGLDRKGITVSQIAKLGAERTRPPFVERWFVDTRTNRVAKLGLGGTQLHLGVEYEDRLMGR